LRLAALVGLITVSVVSVSIGDSIFDTQGTGKNVTPVAGVTRAMGGAVIASTDPLDCAVSNPFASAWADRVTITAGISHLNTMTETPGEDKRSINTLFPTLTAIIPYKWMSFMTGLYLEKEGRLELALTDTSYGEIYDFSFRREVSAHSVPLYLSVRPHPRVTLSAGILFSAFDIRETHKVDYISDARTDADDAIDLSASGRTFAGGMLVNLGPIRAAGLFRGKMNMDGAVERESRYADVWETKDVDLASEDSYRLGVRLVPHQHFALEVDYEKSPWSGIKVNDESISRDPVHRWSVGMAYRGDILWDAARYPVLVGYYRQPLDWDSPSTGEIVEQVFSLGTSIQLAEGRAAVSMALEFGQRDSESMSDLGETYYGLSVSVSAIEAWRREVRTRP
jgi:hypothetical protein